MVSLDDCLRAAENLSSLMEPSPLAFNTRLSSRYGSKIWLKREDTLPVRSFKLRGAYHKITSMESQELQQGIVCASAGNHAQGVAYACALLRIRGIIFMPTTTPKQKISRVRHFGEDWIEIVLTGDNFDAAQTEAQSFACRQNMPFIPPFDDPAVIAGQATLGLEILKQVREVVDYLIVPVGGGGLLAGLVTVFKSLSPLTSIIGVEALGAPALFESLKAGSALALPEIDPFADGIAVKKVGELTFGLCRNSVEKIVLVPEGHICSVMLELYNEEALVAEPAGAIAIAALHYLREEIKDKNVVAIVSGGNNDISRTEEVKERADLFEGRKHYFLIRFPQRAGALKEFLEVLGPGDDITHFQYTKKHNKETGPALVGLELKEKEGLMPLMDKMQQRSISYRHINQNPLLFDMLI